MAGAPFRKLVLTGRGMGSYSYSHPHGSATADTAHEEGLQWEAGGLAMCLQTGTSFTGTGLQA